MPKPKLNIKDELYNLHEIAYDTGDFVYAIVTLPN